MASCERNVTLIGVTGPDKHHKPSKRLVGRGSLLAKQRNVDSNGWKTANHKPRISQLEAMAQERVVAAFCLSILLDEVGYTRSILSHIP